MTMLHELRQYYDIDYRVFLVKAQLRTLAHSSLKLSPYMSRLERMTEEARWLFSLVDEDGSGLIDSRELRRMIEKTRMKVKVRDVELEHIMDIFDADGSGEVDDTEFRDWYMNDSDVWLSKRRRSPGDEFRDTSLLRRGSVRFDGDVKSLIDVFWTLVDGDGNGQVHINEYTELSLNLQRAMWKTEREKDGKKKKGEERSEGDFDEGRGVENAHKEWQTDSQGFDFLDYR